MIPFNTVHMIKLADFTQDELDEWLSAEHLAGSPTGRSYRSAQISQWLGRGVQSFDEMTNLPRELRAELSLRAITGIPEIVAEARSRRDGTVKYGMKLSDGCIVETVLMRYRHGYAVCVSSQAGCRMGCTFCATKPQNFSRNLSSGEMFGQVTAVARRQAADGMTGDGYSADKKKQRIRIGNIVVMGIGDPFDNYENTLKFIRLLHSNDETSISYRKFTI